jgi:hypothetical protein
VIAAAAVIVLAAVGTTAFLAGKAKPTQTNNQGNVITASSPAVASTGPSPSVSPSSASPTQLPGAAAMATLGTYLSQSAAVRPTVGTAISGVQSCRESPASAAATIQQAINTRQNILNNLPNLDVSQLPNGSRLVTALSAAMQNSLNSDTDYHAWMEDLVNSGNSCGANASQDSNYAAAQTADTASTNSKTTFVNLWNPMAPRYGQQTYTATGF